MGQVQVGDLIWLHGDVKGQLPVFRHQPFHHHFGGDNAAEVLDLIPAHILRAGHGHPFVLQASVVLVHRQAFQQVGF